MSVTPDLPRRRLAGLFAGLAGLLAIGGVVPLAAATSVAESTAVSTSVSATDAPSPALGYYDPAIGLAGSALRDALHTIVKGNTALTYDAVWTALKVTDVDPDNPANVIESYSGTSIEASHQIGSSCPYTTCWNREHTWAQSLGNFDTDAGPGTDLFHVRPEDSSTNSSRGNKDFKDCTSGCSPVPNCSACEATSTSFEPRAAIKGDIARGLMYMAIRYEGDDSFADLELNDQANGSCGSSTCYIGYSSALLDWAIADQPDATERTRNQVIFDRFQHNRNPFIDNPELVDYLWGSKVGQPWPGPGPTATPTPTATDPAPTCAPVVLQPAATKTSMRKPRTFRAGTSAEVVVRVSAGATGKVTIKVRQGAVGYSVSKRLTASKATLKVGPLRRGNLKLTAVYPGKLIAATGACESGSTGWLGSSRTTTVEVARR
ncbi:MAG: endonuclease I family protein [Nocardioides sp.]